MTTTKETLLLSMYELLKKHGTLTALDAENATDGGIAQSNCGHLLRELVAHGNATRHSPGKGRGAPFIYTFIEGSPPPQNTRKHGRPKVKIPTRARQENREVGERSHKPTPEGIKMLDRIMANMGKANQSNEEG